MNKKALVMMPIAPLYCAPDAKSELDDEALYGMTVDVIEELTDGFLRIRTPYNYTSIVHMSMLTYDEDELVRYSPKSEFLKTVYAPMADVMSEPNFQSAHVITLPRGALIEVTGVHEAWYKVRPIGKAEGYIRKTHLGEYIRTMCVDEDVFRKNVVETALSYMGVQYRWGGKTPMGIDCSGLVSIAYYLNGVSIYRNADIREGFPAHSIPREKMLPGDMIFFKGHVAIYIGNDRYVHATGRAGSDGVVINSLNPSDADYREDLAHGILDTGSIF